MHESDELSSEEAKALQEFIDSHVKFEPIYFGRDGESITFGKWTMLLGNEEYKRVAWTVIGAFEVSTVWIGLDSQRLSTPKIFETQIIGPEFPKPWSQIPRVRRYATLGQAEVGHVETVEWLKAWKELLAEPPEAENE